MKHKTFRRIAGIFCAVLLTTAILPSFVAAYPSASMNISIRIEGISANLYEDALSVPYSGTLTVKQALEYLDANSAAISVTGLDISYVTVVNGEAAGTFGGWDGWLYQVNGADPGVGIDACALHDGDSILLYYGDPFGAGMQYPDVDSSRIAEGILKFTSQDTDYATTPPTVATHPIVGATVTWYYEGATATYVTDANGEVVIPAGQRGIGSHRIQIEKYGSTAVSGKYLPLVLRLSKNAAVEVTAVSSSSSSLSSSSSGSGNVQTGDAPLTFYWVLLALSLGTILTLAAGKMIRSGKPADTKNE